MSAAVRRAALAGLVAALAPACAGDLVMPYELDHDRIVAVRATPAGILPGQRAELDALVSSAAGSPVTASPELATVIAPASLEGTVRFAGGRWFVDAPDEATLARTRAELGLAADAPVPLQVGVAYGGQTLFATKAVLLGQTLDNPSIASATIDGQPAAGVAEIAAPRAGEVTLAVEAGEDDDVNWLTSVGETRDFDLPTAYLEVPADEERSAGDVALVVRTAQGGVAWSVWPVRVSD